LDKDINHKKGQSRKKSVAEKDNSELQWGHHNPIRMNRYNVNQNLAEKHDPAKKRSLKEIGKVLLPVFAGAIAVMVFIGCCLNVGNKFKRTTQEETTFFSELTTKAIQEESIEDERGKKHGMQEPIATQ
jgi:hypothetical protein